MSIYNRKIPSKIQIEKELNENNNWGRWGDKSGYGAINLITEQKRIEAVKLVEYGKSISLSRPLPVSPSDENPYPVQHYMSKIYRGDTGAGAVDYIGMHYHGQASTHIDALCHVWNENGMWNGENPEEVIVESEGFIGNATMVAARTQAYEFAFNVQVGRHWAYSVAGWVKDMDQLATAKTYRSAIGDYQVAANGDYGVAKGFDISLENRGRLINTTIQYTFSQAKANGEYDKAAFGNQEVDAPLQEFTMPFDRPHDLTVQLYSSKLPFKVHASLVGYYQSGFPYTGTYEKPSGEPVEDVKNKYSKRSPAFKQIDISFSKDLTFRDLQLSLGLNVFNLFDIRNVIDLYPETGDADNRSEYYMREVKLPSLGGTKSNSFYDAPWHYSTPREINVFLRIDYK